jgi:hypothetical protein
LQLELWSAVPCWIKFKVLLQLELSDACAAGTGASLGDFTSSSPSVIAHNPSSPQPQQQLYIVGGPNCLWLLRRWRDMADRRSPIHAWLPLLVLSNLCIFSSAWAQADVKCFSEATGLSRRDYPYWCVLCVTRAVP